MLSFYPSTIIVKLKDDSISNSLFSFLLNVNIKSTILLLCFPVKSNVKKKMFFSTLHFSISFLSKSSASSSSESSQRSFCLSSSAPLRYWKWQWERNVCLFVCEMQWMAPCQILPIASKASKYGAGSANIKEEINVISCCTLSGSRE